MKPMLGVKITESDLDLLDYPLIGQTKFDGIRCYVENRVALTRTGKEIPNHFIRKTIKAHCKEGMDGEIIIPGLSFSDVSGVVRSFETFEERNFVFVIFDWALYSSTPYSARHNYLEQELRRLRENKYFKLVENICLENKYDVQSFFREQIMKGEEGIILRHPNSYYKFGRSTKREQYLMKLKYESIGTATVVAETEELDLYGRPKNSLGALIVVSPIYGQFSIGSGFTHAQRKQYWHEPIVGRDVIFNFQKEGMKDKPRFPVFMGVCGP